MKWLDRILKSEVPTAGIASTTHIGGRDINQDSLATLKTDQGTLLVVADGLGGHEGGELASKHFCEQLCIAVQGKLNEFAGNPQQQLPHCIQQAADAMRDTIHQSVGELDAHTTCAIAWVGADNHLTTAHIGDSRIYIFNRDEILWRSRDHSVVQMLVDIGEVEQSDMGQHPEQGSLTRSIDMQGDTRASVKSHGPQHTGTGVLLCSDGLWEEVSDKEIRGLLQADLQRHLDKLVAKAVRRAGKTSDNVTAVAQRF